MEKVRFSWSPYSNDYKCSHPGDMAGHYYPADQVEAMVETAISTETLGASSVKLADAQSRIRNLELTGRRVLDLIKEHGIACSFTNPEIHQITNAFEHELNKEVQYWNITKLEKK